MTDKQEKKGVRVHLWLDHVEWLEENCVRRSQYINALLDKTRGIVRDATTHYPIPR